MSVRDYKMHGATPTGRSRRYTYYTTIRKVTDVRFTVPTAAVEEQMTDLLRDISVDPHVLPRLRALYREHIAALKGPSLKERAQELHERLERLHVEEAALARLYAQGKLTDKNYDTLYREWQAKAFETQQEINRLEVGAEDVVDDLDQALILLACAPQLFVRLETREQGRLLQILFRRIIIDTRGTVVDFALNPPFVYLSSLNGAPPHSPPGREFAQENGAGSGQFQPALPSNNLHKKPPTDEVGPFASMVSFPHCDKLDWLLR
jgi:hypothetical protein